jgi:hypothetical protein
MPSSRSIFLLVLIFIAPAVANAQQVYDGNQYLPPFGSYTGSDFDVVSLQNGNINIHIPIVGVQQRQGAVSYTLIYDTPDFAKTQDTETDSRGRRFFVNLVSRSADTPGGWRVLPTGDSALWSVDSPLGQQVCSSTSSKAIYSNWTILDPQGGMHPLPLVTGGCTPISTDSGPTLDGSGMTATVNQNFSQAGAPYTAVITLKDGTTISLQGNREDSNGNIVAPGFVDDLNRTVLNNISNPPAKTFTTPLGRAVNSSFTSSSLNVIDSNGTPQTFRIDYTAIDIQTSFCTPGDKIAPNSCAEANQGWVVPVKLTLPN